MICVTGALQAMTYIENRMQAYKPESMTCSINRFASEVDHGFVQPTVKRNLLASDEDSAIFIHPKGAAHEQCRMSYKKFDPDETYELVSLWDVTPAIIGGLEHFLQPERVTKFEKKDTSKVVRLSLIPLQEAIIGQLNQERIQDIQRGVQRGELEESKQCTESLLRNFARAKRFMENTKDLNKYTVEGVVAFEEKSTRYSMESRPQSYQFKSEGGKENLARLQQQYTRVLHGANQELTDLDNSTP